LVGLLGLGFSGLRLQQKLGWLRIDEMLDDLRGVGFGAGLG
jgi:hypothetical protein